MPTTRSYQPPPEPPAHGNDVAILERTISDIYQDELYAPALNTLVSVPTLQKASGYKARGNSSAKEYSQDSSPFSSSSEQDSQRYPSCSVPDSPSESRIGAASWVMQQQDAALTDHHPRCGSRCPSKTVSPKEALLEHNQTEFNAAPPLFNDETQSTVVDCLYGCSAGPMSLMTTVAALIERPDKALEPEVEKLKTNLWRTVNKETESVCRNTSSQGQDGRDGMLEEVEVNGMQELMSWAMMIIIYRRLGSIKPDNLIKHLAQWTLKLLEGLPVDGRMHSGVLFPLFIAGCESGSPDDRDRVCKWYEALEKLGMTQVSLSYPSAPTDS